MFTRHYYIIVQINVKKEFQDCSDYSVYVSVYGKFEAISFLDGPLGPILNTDKERRLT